MRAALLIVVVACSARPPPAPPVPSDGTRSCRDAVAGLERATRAIRDPDASLTGALGARCHDDVWPPAAIDCFATMTDDDLGTCAGMLDERDREKLFSVLGGDQDDRATIALAIARLASVRVGITECDRFVTAVAGVLACERMPLEQRLDLGNETADFWSLPTDRLSADARQRMAAACGKSLADLAIRAGELGCNVPPSGPSSPHLPGGP